MGGNNASLLESIKTTKKNIIINSEAVITAHITFNNNYNTFLTLAEQLEDKLKEIEVREHGAEKRQKEIEDKDQQLHQRESTCNERERKIETREKEVVAKEDKWVAVEEDEREPQQVAKYYQGQCGYEPLPTYPSHPSSFTFPYPPFLFPLTSLMIHKSHLLLLLASTSLL